MNTAPTEIDTLSLPAALPICPRKHGAGVVVEREERLPRRLSRLAEGAADEDGVAARRQRDRKSTRLNSSHANISYAVFCLKKKIMSISQSPIYTSRSHTDNET